MYNAVVNPHSFQVETAMFGFVHMLKYKGFASSWCTDCPIFMLVSVVSYDQLF